MVISLLIVSCKKEYTCTCVNPNGSFIAFSDKTTKGKASEKCDDYYNENYGSVPFNETSCSIE